MIAGIASNRFRSLVETPEAREVVADTFRRSSRPVSLSVLLNLVGVDVDGIPPLDPGQRPDEAVPGSDA